MNKPKAPVDFKKQVEICKTAADAAIRKLKIQESDWLARWNEAPNPFVAVTNYFSVAQRSIRAKATARRNAAMQALQNAEEAFAKSKKQSKKQSQEVE
jgi:hypothetical protein